MSKHRNPAGAQTHWVIQMRDGYTHHAVGDLHVMPKKSALVFNNCGTDRPHLVFGVVLKLIQSIEAIEAAP
jgi:hypothetical protein